ncbi:hypothetical protein SEUCBS139899_002868 [Sporothrix eucalyptigena]
MHREILARLAGVERRLSVLQPPPPPPPHGHRDYRGYDAWSTDNQASPTSAAAMDRVLEPDGQTFAGEVSINQAFDGIAASVLDAEGEVGATSPATGSANGGVGDVEENKTGNRDDDGAGAPRKVHGWLERIMTSHGIVVDEAAWRRLLQLYIDEVYVLYPLLHPPTLWAVFDGLWETAAPWDLSSPAEREQRRLSVAMVCFCLALGCCSLPLPTRRDDAHGAQSAGWSLYSVGVCLMQDVTGLSSTASKSLLTLQLLLLRVLYLFRLDATQGAARVLALAVANGHIMRLHRQSTLERLPVVVSQMSCRAWWCLYVLDRRIALESGQPLLLHDSNIDTALPLELSDAWLGRYNTGTGTAADLHADIAAELARQPVTSITYLLVRIRFSRIISRAWELLYGIRPPAATATSTSSTSSAMVECTDAMLCRLLDKMPSCLAYDPYVPLEIQFRDRPRWLVMQSVVLYTCCTFLRLLIQTLSLSNLQAAHRTDDEDDDDELQAVTVCASLAASILEGNNRLSDDGLKYSFPISHYLTSATMVMATLVSKEPALKRKYAGAILAATQSLHGYCNRTWVSRKMVQWVARLGIFVKRTLADTSCGPLAGPSLMSGSTIQSASSPPSPGRPPAERGESATVLAPTASDSTGSNGGRQPGAAAPWTAGTGAESFLEMPDWLTLPNMDFGPVMAGSTGFDPSGNPTGLTSLSEDLLGPVRPNGLGFGRDPYGVFGSLGRTGFFSMDMDCDASGVDPSIGGLASPLLGI